MYLCIIFFFHLGGIINFYSYTNFNVIAAKKFKNDFLVAHSTFDKNRIHL